MAKITTEVAELINAQIALEFEAANQYLAMAVHLEGRSLEYAAAFFYTQADEERAHAMKFVRYLLEIGARPVVPSVSQPPADHGSLADVVAASLANEQRVTAAIHSIVDAALEAKDHRTFQFLQWFVEEQIEEEASFEKLIDVIAMAQNELQAEHYMRHMGPAEA
jgi:ferritin